MIDMAKIGPSKNTRPERIVYMWMVRQGIRHTRNDRSLPGSPDVVIHSLKVAVFVDGRFWHCPRSKARRISRFWRDKIDRNVARDKRNRRMLRRLGYNIVRIWDSDLKSSSWQSRLSRRLTPPSAPSMAERSFRRHTAHPDRGSRSHPERTAAFWPRHT